MKVFKILSHPYTLIICFLMILISGEHLGGFYVLYLLLALPHGGSHSLLALAGIIVLLAGHYKFRGRKTHKIEVFLNLMGLVLLIASLWFFFWNDKQHYNWGTFDQTVPLLGIIFTSCVAICFLISNVGIIQMPRKINGSLS